MACAAERLAWSARRRGTGPARRARIASVCLALVVACAFGVSSSAAKRSIVPAAGAGCAAFGNASDFAVFSDGEVNFSEARGTSVVGRIAAAGQRDARRHLGYAGRRRRRPDADHRR